MKESDKTLLDQIKDQVANDHGMDTCAFALNVYAKSDARRIDLMIDEIANRFATAKAQASTAHSFTESAYKEFEGKDLHIVTPESPEPQEKCSTCGKARSENGFCSNSFHLTAPSESQEELIKDLILLLWNGDGYLGFKAIDNVKSKFTITRNP